MRTRIPTSGTGRGRVRGERTSHPSAPTTARRRPCFVQCGGSGRGRGWARTAYAFAFCALCSLAARVLREQARVRVRGGPCRDCARTSGGGGDAPEAFTVRAPRVHREGRPLSRSPGRDSSTPTPCTSIPRSPARPCMSSPPRLLPHLRTAPHRRRPRRQGHPGRQERRSRAQDPSPFSLSSWSLAASPAVMAAALSTLCPTRSRSLHQSPMSLIAGMRMAIMKMMGRVIGRRRLRYGCRRAGPVLCSGSGQGRGWAWAACASCGLCLFPAPVLRERARAKSRRRPCRDCVRARAGGDTDSEFEEGGGAGGGSRSGAASSLACPRLSVAPCAWGAILRVSSTS
jgi:hypothetical protein